MLPTVKIQYDYSLSLAELVTDLQSVKSPSFRHQRFSSCRELGLRLEMAENTTQDAADDQLQEATGSTQDGNPQNFLTEERFVSTDFCLIALLDGWFSGHVLMISAKINKKTLINI